MTSSYIQECVGSPLELPLGHTSNGRARLIGNAHPTQCPGFMVYMYVRVCINVHVYACMSALYVHVCTCTCV